MAKACGDNKAAPNRGSTKSSRESVTDLDLLVGGLVVRHQLRLGHGGGVGM